VALNCENYSDSEIVKQGDEVFRVFRPKLTQKNGVFALIHLGTESVAAIDAYLATRTVNPNDPLFPDDENKRMHPVTLTMLFSRMCSSINGGRKNLGAHSMRKYYITMLQSAGLSENWIKKLCGKKLSKSDAGYVKPEDLGLLTPAYIKGYGSLRVFGGEVGRAEMEDMKAQVAEMKKGYEMMKNEYQRITGSEIVSFEPTSAFGKESEEEMFKQFLEWRKRAK
jgi:hypothetical protein